MLGRLARVHSRLLDVGDQINHAVLGRHRLRWLCDSWEKHLLAGSREPADEFK